MQCNPDPIDDLHETLCALAAVEDILCLSGENLHMLKPGNLHSLLRVLRASALAAEERLRAERRLGLLRSAA